MFGGLTADRMRRMFFDLGYSAHGGSGLRYSWEVVQDMPVSEIMWYVRHLDETRTEEAKQIQRAHRRR